jgi:hypothetical protein
MDLEIISVETHDWESAKTIKKFFDKRETFQTGTIIFPNAFSSMTARRTSAASAKGKVLPTIGF